MRSSEPVARRESPPSDLAGVLEVFVIAVVLGWLLIVSAILKRPLLAVPVAGYVGLSVWLAPSDAQGVVLWLVLLLVAWRVVHRRSFERLVGRWLRPAFRRWWVYELRWRRTMVHSGLGKRFRLRESVPTIRRVKSSPWGDRVLV
jgi:hypothetical protein